MFTIKTHVGPSAIHGSGVFADEPLKANEIIWKFQEKFDVRITEIEYENLPKIAKEYITHFGYFSSKEGGWILCSDNAKYTNHSTNPNMKMFDNFSSVSTIDINIGDEITENYFVFDEKAKEKIK